MPSLAVHVGCGRPQKLSPALGIQGTWACLGRGCGGELLSDSKREPWLLLPGRGISSSTSLTSFMASGLPGGPVGTRVAVSACHWILAGSSDWHQVSRS